MQPTLQTLQPMTVILTENKFRHSGLQNRCGLGYNHQVNIQVPMLEHHSEANSNQTALLP